MKLPIPCVIWTHQFWLCHHDTAPLSVKVRAVSRSDVYIYSGYRRWYYFHKSRFVRNGLQSCGCQSHVTNHGGCSRQKRHKGECIYVPKHTLTSCCVSDIDVTLLCSMTRRQKSSTPAGSSRLWTSAWVCCPETNLSMSAASDCPGRCTEFYFGRQRPVRLLLVCDVASHKFRGWMAQ